jgi:hypothetical protein
MRKGRAVGASLAVAALLACAGGFAQNDRNAVNGAQEPVSGTQMPPVRQIRMVSAKAELQKGLNAKKLKPGQAVTAKLEQKVTLPNEPALQRNTVLLGKVDAVEASQHHSNSKITVTFDQAKLKDGTVLPVKVTVMQVSDPSLARTQAEADTGAPMAGGAPGPAPAPGAAGAPGPSPGMQAPQPAEPMNMPRGGGAHHQNGIPGVMLRSNIHESASATFLSKGRNVDVPGGTEMQVAIAVIPKGVQVH